MRHSFRGRGLFLVGVLVAALVPSGPPVAAQSAPPIRPSVVRDDAQPLLPSEVHVEYITAGMPTAIPNELRYVTHFYVVGAGNADWTGYIGAARATAANLGTPVIYIQAVLKRPPNQDNLPEQYRTDVVDVSTRQTRARPQTRYVLVYAFRRLPRLDPVVVSTPADPTDAHRGTSSLGTPLRR